MSIGNTVSLTPRGRGCREAGAVQDGREGGKRGKGLDPVEGVPGGLRMCLGQNSAREEIGIETGSAAAGGVAARARNTYIR
jgi:hypothetical protein